MSRDMLTVARAEALFASPLPAGAYDAAELTAAIRSTVRTYGGVRGCAERMAVEYGEHPELAARRMLWARQAVEPLARRRAVA